VTTAVTSEPATLGAAAPGFSQVAGVDGRHYSLSSFDGREVLALVFLGNGCPTAKSCEDALIELQAAYDSRGVGLVAINPNNPYLSPPDTLREMSRRACAKGYNFPYLKDPDATLARAYGVTRTPQVCLLGGARAGDRRVRLLHRLVKDSRRSGRSPAHTREIPHLRKLAVGGDTEGRR
jgi:peroxiredoxin